LALSIDTLDLSFVARCSDVSAHVPSISLGMAARRISSAAAGDNVNAARASMANRFSPSGSTSLE
jgi:hypothetical protein